MKGFDEMAARQAACFRHIGNRYVPGKVFEKKSFRHSLLPRSEFAGRLLPALADAAIQVRDMRLEGERDMVDKKLRCMLGLH